MSAHARHPRRSRLSRTRLLLDLVIATALAAALLALSAGLGVVAFVAVPILAILVLSLLVERAVLRRRDPGRLGR